MPFESAKSAKNEYMPELIRILVKDIEEYAEIGFFVVKMSEMSRKVFHKERNMRSK